MKLSHEETLKRIHDQRAWRLAKKTKPIWVREVRPDEVGKEFQTADHLTEKAQVGYVLCVGVAGEPWFQRAERVEAKYDPSGEEQKKFSFDDEPQTYRIYQPKEGTRNWAAQVAGPDIEGFSIRPNYDVEHPLYSPAGGYVVKDFVPDPYEGNPDDVWLVQQPLFESTYEFVEDSPDSP